MNVPEQSLPTLQDGEVLLGVDTHKDQNTCVILDHRGGILDRFEVPTTPAGNVEVTTRAASHGALVAAGVECTGSYGRSLTTHLQALGVLVWDVRHVDKALRRRRGKDDTQDAEAAARSLLAGVGTSPAKAHDGDAEELRALTNARDALVHAHVQLINTLKALVLTAPDDLRSELRGLSDKDLLKTCAAYRPGRQVGVGASTKVSLKALAKEILTLHEQERALERRMAKLVQAHHPTLLALPGVGVVTAASIVAEVGDDPSAFTPDGLAAHAGCAPVPASSGQTSRMRLRRGGNRTLNKAFHTVSLTQMRCHPPAHMYAAEARQHGKSPKDIRRAHKKYVARAVWSALVADHQGVNLSTGEVS